MCGLGWHVTNITLRKRLTGNGMALQLPLAGMYVCGWEGEVEGGGGRLQF